MPRFQKGPTEPNRDLGSAGLGSVRLNFRVLLGSLLCLLHMLYYDINDIKRPSKNERLEPRLVLAEPNRDLFCVAETEICRDFEKGLPNRTEISVRFGSAKSRFGPSLMHTRKVKACPESKCLHGEHKHQGSTCWGMEFFLSCKIRVYAFPESKCLPEGILLPGK